MGILNQLMGIQECQSIHGEHVDWMLELVHWFMALLGVGWSIFLAYVLVRYHKSRNRKALHSGVQNHATTHIEVGVIITEIILLLGFAFPLWGQRVDGIPTDADVQIRAVAQQFSWTFHYPGADKKFGNTNPRFINAWNSVGIDPDDENGKDDILAGEMAVPEQKKIVVGITSKDVIHNLALKAVRQAADANPGQINRVWFQPTKKGTTEIICGQLCGPGHGSMKALMTVMNDKDFETWQGDQTKFETVVPGYKPPAPAAVPTAAAAPTATPVAVAAPGAAPAAAPAAPAAAAGAEHLVEMGVIPNVMKFDKPEFSVKPGDKVKVVFKNEKCALQHNMMICKPGTIEKVTAAANASLTNPDFLTKMQGYPVSADILFRGNKLIGPGQSDTFEFTAPAEEGDYPYICAFPGHAFLMRGVMHVKK